MNDVSRFYGSDISNSILETQLLSFQNLFEDKTISFYRIIEAFKNNTQNKVLFSEVFVILKLLLASPATNASSERSFSAMQQVNTYLRSTMGQQKPHVTACT